MACLPFFLAGKWRLFLAVLRPFDRLRGRRKRPLSVCIKKWQDLLWGHFCCAGESAAIIKKKKRPCNKKGFSCFKI
ncbi:MAG TPA: hypothetical protein DCZ76_12135 [Treponema sp.]|nr:hypothetical protein [Treponema sp.]